MSKCLKLMVYLRNKLKDYLLFELSNNSRWIIVYMTTKFNHLLYYNLEIKICLPEEHAWYSKVWLGRHISTAKTCEVLCEITQMVRSTARSTTWWDTMSSVSILLTVSPSLPVSVSLISHITLSLNIPLAVVTHCVSVASSQCLCFLVLVSLSIICPLPVSSLTPLVSLLCYLYYNYSLCLCQLLIVSLYYFASVSCHLFHVPLCYLLQCISAT